MRNPSVVRSETSPFDSTAHPLGLRASAWGLAALGAVAVSVAGCAATQSPAVDGSGGIHTPGSDPQPLPGGEDITRARLKAVAEGAHRSEANRARDAHRHPVETLMFFGLRSEMRVVELYPGRGWYTELLAPTVLGSGSLVVTSADPNGDPESYGVKRALDLIALESAHPDLFEGLEKAILNEGEPLSFGKPESADLVVSFRSFHNWMRRDRLADVLKAVHAVLKPGGVFGLVSHRASAEMGSKPDTGYVTEADAIAAVEAAGFELGARSEINANPADTKDHPEGVWTLPPSLRLGAQDRARYVEIGESDRFTLRFVKR